MKFGVAESIEHWARYRSSDIAAISNGAEITFVELERRGEVICDALGKVSIENQRIAILVKKKIDFLSSLIAVLRAGKSAVLINCGLKPSSILASIEDSEAVSFIVSEEYYRLIHDMDTDSRFKIVKLDQIDNSNIKSRTISQLRNFRKPQDEWGVLFSSGTTGHPKGINRPHESIVSELLDWCLELGITRNSCFYVGRPLYYAGGLVLSLSTLLVGGTVIVNDYEDYNNSAVVWDDYQNQLRMREITFAFFVPDQIRDFIGFVEKNGMTPLKAQKVLVMGAAISGDEKIKANKILGSDIIESWGNSESLGTITDPEDLKIRPDSIGRPFLTDIMCVVDDTARQLPNNELGMIAGGEEGGFTEYCKRPKETQRAKRSGLLISEDLGYTDENGYYYIKGRIQDHAFILGHNVWITEIEKKLLKSYLVKDCCVVSEALSEASVRLLCAAVLSKDNQLSEGELLETLNKQLEECERISIVKIVDSIPHLPSGKPDKITVRTQFANST